MTKKLFTLIATYLMLNSASVFSQALFEWGKIYDGIAATTTDGKYDITLRNATADNVKMFLQRSTVSVYAFLPGQKKYDVNPKINEETLQSRIVTTNGQGTLDTMLTNDITNKDIIQWLGTLNDKDSVVLKPFLGDEVKNQGTLIVTYKSEVPLPYLNDKGTTGGSDCYQPTLTDQLIRRHIDTIEKRFQKLIGSNSERVRWDCNDKHKRICPDCVKEKEVSTTKDEHSNDCYGIKDNTLETQLNNRIIYYDFEKKYFFKRTATGRELFNFNSWQFACNRNRQIKIININRYLYEVSVESQALEYDSETPALFRNLFLGDSTTTLGTLLDIFENQFSNSPDGPTPKKGDIDSSVLKKECFNKIEFKYNLLQDVLVHYHSMSNYLKRRKLEVFALCSKFPCCCGNDNNDLGMMYEMMLNSLQHITGLSSELQMLLKLEQAKPEAHKDLPALIQQLQARLPNEADLTKLFLFVQNIRNTNDEFITPPIKITGNRFELLMKFKPWDASMDKPNDPDRPYVSQWNSGPYYKDEIYIDLPVLFNPFVSFSSGSFVGLNRNLQEITYEWQKIPSTGNVITDSARYNLVQTGYSKLPIGFCALVNLQSKVCSMVGLGISAGVGLTIESKPRIAYLAGGSLFFGDLKQCVLTAGFAGMQVDRLNHDLKAYADQGVIAYERTRPDIKYYNEFKVGGFISLSYTPFKVNRRPVYNESLRANAEEARQKKASSQSTKEDVATADAKLKSATARAKEEHDRAKLEHDKTNYEVEKAKLEIAKKQKEAELKDLNKPE